MQTHRFARHIVPLMTLLVLAACGSRATPAPTQDTSAIFTQAAQTVAAGFTQTAVAQPTSTPLPTDTPTQAAPPSTFAPGLTPFTINTPVVLASATLSIPPLGTATGNICNNSLYQGDVGTPDGTVLKPGQVFAKGWLLMNTGSCKWTLGYSLQRVGGNTDFGAANFVIRNAKDVVNSGQTGEFSLRLVAPKTPGTYEAIYQMFSDKSIPFGTAVTVSIVVKK